MSITKSSLLQAEIELANAFVIADEAVRKYWAIRKKRDKILKKIKGK